MLAGLLAAYSPAARALSRFRSGRARKADRPRRTRSKACRAATCRVDRRSAVGALAAVLPSGSVCRFGFNALETMSCQHQHDAEQQTYQRRVEGNTKISNNLWNAIWRIRSGERAAHPTHGADEPDGRNGPDR